MNAVVEVKEPNLPAPVIRAGISEAQWRTLDQLYPNARGESKLLVWFYCLARKLDPMKKPCHIVPMPFDGVWRDVVMPGIYEYRTTAMRTGQYCGHSEPVFGPLVEFMGAQVPEYCKLTVFRWNDQAKKECAYPAKAKFSECAGTRWDKDAKCHKLNARWTKAPEQMLEKCTEAAALRKAFPDELGGEHTAEEMEGQQQTVELDITPGLGNPRPDLSEVDWTLRDKRVTEITDLVNEYGNDENALADKFREYHAEYLQPFPELFIAVNDKLAKDGVISKGALKKLMSLGLQGSTRDADKRW